MIRNKDLVKNILKGLFVFFLFWFSAYLQLIPILIFKLNIRNLSGSMQVILSTFSSLIVCIILLLIYQKSLKKDFKKFTDDFLENINAGFKYWFIGLLVMMVSNIILTGIFKSGGANNENAVQEMIKNLPWLMVINAGVLAPINEEIVFRKTLKDIFKNKWVFVLLSFLLFGGAHVIGGAETLVDYLYIIPYGALGGAFALAYYETDTIFTPLSMHMIHNTLLTILSGLV